MSRPGQGGGAWRDRQERDPYVKRARRDGWRSRAAYKLEQIAAKEPILYRGMTCIDLGAAPGSWSQFVTERLKNEVRILAVDLLPMDSLPSVDFIQGDFAEDGVFQALLELLGDSRADLVMSDMAPNFSGNKAIDQPKSMLLAELALHAATRVMRPKGNFVCKLFQGQGSDDFVGQARRLFATVRVMKPGASRPGSSEVYLVARNYRL